MSNNRLFVGNLSYSTTDDSLSAAFGEYGTVKSARVVTDRETGRSRGFGFVEMDNNEEARAAMDGLNQTEVDDRFIRVDLAKPRE